MDDGYLDVEHLVLLILGAPIVGFGLAIVVPKIWRMRADGPPPKPRRWTLRQALRGGWIRTLPLNFVQLLFLELAGIAAFFEKLLSGAGGFVAGDFAIALGWTFVALLLVWPIVALFNRPRIAVPPVMRDEHGALALWWRSRHGPVAKVRERDRPRSMEVVVGAAIVREGRVLAQQRAYPAEAAGRWELPGGRVEPGESDVDAMRRECLEELGVRVLVGDRVGSDVPLPPGMVLRVYAAALDPPDAVPHPHDHRAVRWLTMSTLDSVDWLPADRVLLPQLRALLADPGKAQR